ncbi:ABC transporter [Pseudothauera nasutitermitis]|uniref:ABC transporter n=1 Tax=Pseudothauera nasutitermitis TaxID=2565930 RepID=A0A4V3WBM0_9RHOO|nr:ABC-type transport auxiliary lipoprotein family protein [Pseudothauera nasutitermitis]THF63753.1 ABC transporter [Pseudothauera nasutitermitis]
MSPTSDRQRRPAAPIALLASALLTACSVLPRAEPIDLYLLPASATAAAEADPVDFALRINRPESSRHLAGQRIVVQPEGDRVSIYKGASWSDPAPVLVRNRLLDAFRADGRIAALSSDERALYADLELDSDLRAFQSEYRDGTPEAVIRLDVRLVAPATRRILASRSFEVRQPAAGTGVPEVVRAFGEAGDALSARLVSWTLEQAAAQRGR